MHPKQASLLQSTKELNEKLMGRTAAGLVLWKYVEDGKDFYLPVKKTTVKSPYTGKSLSGIKPERLNMSEVTQELKSDAKAKAKTAQQQDQDEEDQDQD